MDYPTQKGILAMNNIIIVAAADEKYAIFFCTMAASVLKHASPEDKYCFKLLTDGFSIETKKRIQALRKIRKCKIDFVEIDSTQFAEIPTLKHLSAMTNARLKITSLFPVLNKIIYLDCDIIIKQDLASLWNTDIKEFPLAACMDYGATRKELNTLGFVLERYFNAGVLVLDLRKLKENGFENRVINLLINNTHLRHDQDILNEAFKNQWKRLSLHWNIQPELLPKLLKQYSKKLQVEFKTALRNPSIIHYGGKKPSTYLFRGKYQKEFWKYLKLTEYRDHKTTDISFHNFLRKHVPNFLQIQYCKLKNIFLSKGGS